MKTCIVDDCHNPVFAKLYCKWHQHLRKDKPTIKTNKSIVASIRPSKTDFKTKITGESVLFKTIWDTRPHVSFLSGKKILEPRPENFAHVLSKGKYPLFRLLDKNIILLTREEHFLLDQGTESQRLKYSLDHNCSWTIIEKLKEQLLYEYRQR